MEERSEIESRKDDHLRINLEEDVHSGLTTGLEHIALEHCALPEMDFKDVDTSTTFLGKHLGIPLIISSMTGGTNDGDQININLALAAQETKVAMALGSLRNVLEGRSETNSFRLRKYAPDIPIYANIGAVQLNYGVGLVECRRLVELASADGLILHLNPLQEALQPEGNKNFSDLLTKISSLCKTIGVPVIVKEVGWGISADLCLQLKGIGVSAVDVAGAGGTSWSQVEMFRMNNESDRRIASHFRKWGIPTAATLISLQQSQFDMPTIASGGLSNGIEVAKCLALSADLCGMAGRLLKAAAISTEEVIKTLSEIKKELRIAMFVSGAQNIQALQHVRTFPIE